MNFLGNICWQYRPNLKAPGKKLSPTRWMKYLLLMLAVGCLAAACATPPPISISEALTNAEDEKILWRRAREEQQVLNNSGLLYRDPELENYLNQVARKLQGFTDSAGISFDIKVVNDPNLNAFAFPNGVIYIHTGVLARLDNEAQLAALLAHEMTHCTHRHSLRVVKSIANRPGVMAAVSQPLRKIAMVRDLARLLGASGSMAAVTGYNREFEAEADRVGLDLIVKAGYDPRQVLDLFEHLRQEIEIEGIKEPYFFGTHPSVQQRIENASRWLATEYSGDEAGLINLEIFRTRLNKLVLDNARLDLRMGRFYMARKGVGKYLRQNPSDAGAYYLIGEIYRQQGRQDDTQKAILNYEKAIALDPSLPAPHRAMGLMHYKAGQRRLAQKFFESCLLLSPNALDNAFIQGYLQRCIDGGEES
jgi:predicted Zn-dependent protease